MDILTYAALLNKIKNAGASDEKIAQAVNEWLEDHPEAITVNDGSISYIKLDSGLQEAIDDLDDLMTESETIKSATSADIGKALKVKSVVSGKVTEWELGLANDNETVDVTIPGTDPIIVGNKNTRYICGTLSTLDFTPPAEGIVDIIFTSGSSKTILTLPNTVKMPDWFEVEANTTYEISIADGVYGVVTSWAV